MNIKLFNGYKYSTNKVIDYVDAFICIAIAKYLLPLNKGTR